ncbi:hypothetical protein [Candidatus Venteria ishoeyi]|uniref:Yip1 domain protein n=1 Tax=Candidatus Venteria ishoeyi TaxID=1899563 RepID=A0A1H6F889_9GAMM|nr:hypothetical protein [Candidatus Venteria ishoeyi]SEH06340.1 Uncharacterised protein [Candidatus Venteria ishoeyi]
MIRLEKFNLFAIILGLVVNIITILGLLLGFVEAKPDVSFLLSKPAITIITAILLLYSNIGLSYYFLHSLKNRWAKRSVAPTLNTFFTGFFILIAMFWIPFFWLWIIGMYELWEIKSLTSPKELKDSTDAAFLIAFFGAVGIPFLIQKIIIIIDNFLNPN